MGAAVVGPGPLLLGRASPSLAAGLGDQDPQAWFFAPVGMGSEALGKGARVWALGPVRMGQAIRAWASDALRAVGWGLGARA